MKRFIFNFKHLRTIMLLFLIGFSNMGYGQEQSAPQFHDSMYSQPVFIALIVAIIFMMIFIIALNEILKSLLIYKTKKKSSKTNSSKIVSAIALMILIPNLLLAQEAMVNPEIPQFPEKIYGLDATVFFTLLAFLIFEIIVALFLVRQIKYYLPVKEKVKTSEVQTEKVTLLDRLNASVSLEKEKDILLDHNYDGIQELDNDLPPWWKYGFYTTIIFACLYLFHFHILKTGYSQIQEFENENRVAENAIEEYKKNASNLVDENTVTFINDEASLNEGRSLFASKCVACHGNLGEGTSIAPNLTDDYWLHGGSIKDIFISIKYGWIEKGMRSWQDELNPKQMHVVANYVKSLRGSNPPNAKEKQGELYIDEGVTTTDSTTIMVKDSL